jgi:hypothetical protein
MTRALFATILLSALTVAGAATAGPSLNEAWYVKKDTAGAAMLTDRAACVIDAQQFGVDRASDFSNPEYGSLTALGAALDEGGLRGDAKQAVRRAVRDACMQKKGWARIDVSDADAKALKKAKGRNTEALDAWLVANTPKPKPTAPPVATPVSVTASAPTAAADAPQPKAPDPAAPRP